MTARVAGLAGAEFCGLESANSWTRRPRSVFSSLLPGIRQFQPFSTEPRCARAEFERENARLKKIVAEQAMDIESREIVSIHGAPWLMIAYFDARERPAVCTKPYVPRKFVE